MSKRYRMGVFFIVCFCIFFVSVVCTRAFASPKRPQFIEAKPADLEYLQIAYRKDCPSGACMLDLPLIFDQAQKIDPNFTQLTKLLFQTLKSNNKEISFLGRTNREIFITTKPVSTNPQEKAYYQVRLLKNTCSSSDYRNGQEYICAIQVYSNLIRLQANHRKTVVDTDHLTESLEQLVYHFLYEGL